MAAGTKIEAMTAESAAAATASKTKRKSAPKEDEDESGDESDGSDVSMINVDFDFFNLNTDVDQMAVKRLLRQTLSHDDEMIDVHPLAELILSEGVRLAAGSSIKTDGEESDPWGLVGVVDIAKHRDNAALRPFLEYLLASLPARNPIRMLLEEPSSPAMASRPALVFSLRLLNLPLPLIPPLYKMLLNELAEGPEEKQGRGFTHWLLWGRGYRLEGSEEGMGLDMQVDGEDMGGKKKRKGAGAAKGAVTLASGSFPYHPEEEYIDKVATYVHEYPFKTAPTRDEDAFGVEQFGRLVLIEKPRLGQAVQAMEAACQ